MKTVFVLLEFFFFQDQSIIADIKGENKLDNQRPLTSSRILQGHPEGRGLSSLRGHGRAVPAAYGRYLEPLQVLQQHPAGGHGAGTRGPEDRVVQPLCAPPFLRCDGGQLRRDADESHEDPAHHVQSKLASPTGLKCEVSFSLLKRLPGAARRLQVGPD